MNKKITLLATALAFVLSSGAANAAFTGDYAVGNWTFFSSDSGGAVDISGAPSSIILTSSNTGDTSPLHSSDADFTIGAVSESWVSFDGHYLTSDEDGPFDDPAGFLLNGVFIQLTDSTDPLEVDQTGHFNFHVNAGDIFGFRAHSDDSSAGSASSTIDNFNVTAVPEPETYALFMAGLGLMGFIARRRKNGQA